MAGQTINDRLLAARHSLAGQGLAKAVCKATTEEMIGPKKKHLDYLVQCTNEPNVSIPQLANLLIERSQNATWVVVYKSLITVHHMMCYGNDRFTQYLASSNSTFQLSNFLDKSGVQGVVARTGYDMSPFIRRYSRYLNEKALSYRVVAFDFCKVKRGKEDGTLRTMNAEKLLKTLPPLQNQLDALLEFDCSANNLTNGVINTCFMLLFRDLIRLFACYNDGVINLLEKFFDMNKKQCKEALDLYKKFLIRMDRVGEFLKVAENMGINKGDIPDLTKAPSSLLDALEQHLSSLEGKKSNSSTPTQAASSTFGSVAASGKFDSPNGIDESLKKQVLAEEEAAMNQYKSKLQSPNSTTNPFLNSPVAQAPAVNLFAVPAREQTPGKASDDLLQLNNPFADFAQPAQVAPLPSTMWMSNGNGFAAQPMASPTTAFVSESSFNSVFGTTDTTAAYNSAVGGSSALFNPFLSDFPENTAPSEIPSAVPVVDLFDGSGEQQVLDTLICPSPVSFHPESPAVAAIPSPLLSPPRATPSVPVRSAPPPRPPPPVKPPPPLTASDDSINLFGSPDKEPPTGSLISEHDDTPGQKQDLFPGFDGLGDVLQPASSQGGHIMQKNSRNAQHSQQSSALLTGDLESSLASLAENLSINRSAVPVKGVQWNSPKNGAKAASNWQPQPMAATTGAGYRPMGQGMVTLPSSQPLYPQVQPMGIRPMTGATGILMPSQTGGPPSMAQQQSLLFH